MANADIRQLEMDGKVFYPQTDLNALVNNGNYAIDDAPRQNSTNLVTSDAVYSVKSETLQENREMVNSIMENYAPVEITGNVNNAADEEDLTSVNVSGTDVLKFKDKVFNQLVYSGMGKKILRKNMVNGVNTLTQSMINDENTIYVIQYDFSLGENITIPANCVLEFDGGSLSNGTVVGNNTYIDAGIIKIFGTDIIIDGEWNVKEAYPEWFSDDTIGIQKCIDSFSVCFLSEREYHLDSSIALRGASPMLIGKGAIYTKLYFSNNVNGIEVFSNNSIVRNLFVINTFAGNTSKGITNKSAHIKNAIIESVFIDGFSIGIGTDYEHSYCFFSSQFNTIDIRNWTTAAIKFGDPSSSTAITGNVISNIYCNNYKDGSAQPASMGMHFHGMCQSVIQNINIEGVVCPLGALFINSCWGVTIIGVHFEQYNYNTNDFTRTEHYGIRVVDSNIVICGFEMSFSTFTIEENNAMYFFYFGNSRVILDCIDVRNHNLIKESDINRFYLFSCSQYSTVIVNNIIVGENSPESGFAPIPMRISDPYLRLQSFTDNISVRLNSINNSFTPVNGKRVLFTDKNNSTFANNFPIYYTEGKWICADGYKAIKRRGTTAERNSLSLSGDDDKGITFYDFSLGKYGLWNGRWVDNDGFSLNIKKGTLSQAAALSLLYSDFGYQFFATDIKRPIFYNADTQSWIEADGVGAGLSRFGTFATKQPAFIGFRYFCTDRKIDMDSSSPTYMQVITPVSPDTGGMPIYYKGGGVWVDALSRVVS